MAAVSPPALGSGVYTVTASRRLVAELNIVVSIVAPFTALQVRFPAAATGVGVVLGRAGATLDLPVTDGATTSNTMTFANRRVTASARLLADQVVVDCQIRVIAMAGGNEAWSVRARADTAQTWRFDAGSAGATVSRLMCDPAAGFTLSAPSLSGGTVLEQDVVTLTANAATGTLTAPTVVGPPPPISHWFDKTGALAVPGLPACSAVDNLTLPLPAVTADQAISFTHDVWFETDCSAVGFLASTAPPQDVTVRWNPPWTITALTPGPFTVQPGEPAVLRFQVGGRPGASANLGIEAPAAASGWFPGLPKAVTAGPNPVAVEFTAPAGTPGGTAGTFVGVLTAPGTNQVLARSVAIPFEVPVPWTITALTAGPLTPSPGELAELRFQVGGRPGVPANLGIEAPAAASGWFPGLPKAVTAGPNPVAVEFTAPAGTPGGTAGTFVGVLTAPGTNQVLARSVAIPFEVPLPWTITALTAGPLTLHPEEQAVLRFQVGGRPGASADLGVEAPPGWFPALPRAVTPGPGPVDVLFTPPSGVLGGTAGTIVGVLTEPGTGRTLARSAAIPFAFPAPRVDAIVPREIRREREEDTSVAATVRGVGLTAAQASIVRPNGAPVPWLAAAVHSGNDTELGVTITVTGIGPPPTPDELLENFDEDARVRVRTPSGLVATGAPVALRGVRWVE